MSIQIQNYSPIEMTDKQVNRGFKKGLSGNPGGRPKGSKNSLTILKEAVLAKSEDVILEHFPKIVTAVCQKAMEGDMTAAKLIMDRILPTKKAVEFSTKDNQDFGIKIIVQGIETHQSSVTIGKTIDVADGDYKEVDD